jgi:hypothetical protein
VRDLFFSNFKTMGLTTTKPTPTMVTKFKRRTGASLPKKNTVEKFIKTSARLLKFNPDISDADKTSYV